MRFKWNVKDIKVCLLSTLLVLTYSCVQNEIPLEDANSGLGGGSSAGGAYAQLMRVNPIAATGNKSLRAGVDLEQFLSSTLTYIAPAGDLVHTCGATAMYPEFPTSVSAQAQNCVLMVNNENEAITSSGGWAYSANSSSFLDVNSYGLIRENIDRFNEIIATAHYNHHYNLMAKVHPSALPIDLLNPYNLWKTKVYIEGEPAVPTTLKVKANCNAPDKAYYNPALFEICMGYDSVETKLKFSQDPSVLYHELGHLFIDIMLNMRNGESTYKADLGTLFYEEAGVIGEGISDYYSYLNTGRKHFAEWALGRYLNQSRPMSESDSLHIDVLKNSTTGEKLSYPQYITYDPNQPDKVKEDVHYGGQIVSHYLVSLTENLKSTCGWDHKAATGEVVGIIAETLAELGDLTGTGSDYLVLDRFTDDEEAVLRYYTNFNDEHSSLWQQVVNPINMRRFFQTFAKYALYNISYNNCLTFNKDYLEQHLDDYGLLLFETYNDNINDSLGEVSISDVPTIMGEADLDSALGEHDLYANYVAAYGSLDVESREDELTFVNEVNRKKTVLISKDLISLPDENDNENKQAFVFDSRSDVEKSLKNMKFKGEAINLTNGIAGYEYNNSNGSISPGEIVGVMLNLQNNSNTTMAGIHILGNDWDHFRFPEGDTESNLKPCSYNGWPILSEGAALPDADPDSPEPGDCGYTTRNNGQPETEDDPAVDVVTPACLVQMREENETRWVSQDEMRKHLMINAGECLNNSNPDNSSKNNECLIRILPATSHAFMSKIDPQKTYGKSMQSEDGTTRPINSSAALFMEVNKFVPPGTTFVCRFRVGFNNCKDCFSDLSNSSDDYYDYEYSGAKPFKVINFKFMVID